MGSLVNLYRRSVPRVTTEARFRTVLILGGLLVCSLAINLVLARRVASLKRTIGVIKSESRLSVGDTVPAIEAKDPHGRTAVLDYGQTQLPTVVFIITPTCGWCTKNVMNMRALTENVSDRYRFVGLSLSSDKLMDYVKENQLEFPVYTDLPILTLREYKLGGTPQTIVISPSGQVIKIWSGAFSEDVQTEVEDYFSVKLPGIMDPQKAKLD
jgi:peroxiredoxin